jgi:signal transduction histidine kinase/PAS domain-containing protein
MINNVLVEEMMDDAPIAVIGFDSAYKISYVNNHFVSLLGFDRSFVLQQDIGYFLVNSTNKIEFFNKVLSGMTLYDEELIIKSVDGNLHYFMGSTMKFKKDDTLCTYLFFREITKHKKTEQLFEYLNQSSELLSSCYDFTTTLENVTNIIVPIFADWFAVDILEDGKIVNLKLVNTDESYLDWAKEFRKKNNPLDDPNSGLGLALKTGKTTLLNHITSEMIEQAPISKSEKEMFFRLNLQSYIIVPIKVKEKIVGAMTFISSTKGKDYDDIDLRFAQMFANRVGLTLENVQLLEDSKQEILLRKNAENTKNEFINIASHELKTPLTTLKASIQYLPRLIKQNASSEKIDSMLDKANNSILKLSKLVDDLLNVNKIGKDKFELEKSEFVIADMVDSCCDHVRMMGTYRINVKGDLQLKVFADKFKIDQVMVNLINNVVKYAPQTTDIDITISTENNFAKVSVKDYGPGIEKAKVDKLFNRYFQGEYDESYTSGMGLGLFIAKKIISNHQGKIGVDTELGKGSSFWFTLPL